MCYCEGASLPPTCWTSFHLCFLIKRGLTCVTWQSWIRFFISKAVDWLLYFWVWKCRWPETDFTEFVKHFKARRSGCGPPLQTLSWWKLHSQVTYTVRLAWCVISLLEVHVFACCCDLDEDQVPLMTNECRKPASSHTVFLAPHCNCVIF